MVWFPVIILWIVCWYTLWNVVIFFSIEHLRKMQQFSMFSALFLQHKQFEINRKMCSLSLHHANISCFEVLSTQQNSYSISYLWLIVWGTVTTWWLDSDGVVTVDIDNCQQHGDYTVDQLCSRRVAGSFQRKGDYNITVQPLRLVGDWWNKSFAVYTSGKM